MEKQKKEQNDGQNKVYHLKRVLPLGERPSNPDKAWVEVDVLLVSGTVKDLKRICFESSVVEVRDSRLQVLKALGRDE